MPETSLETKGGRKVVSLHATVFQKIEFFSAKTFILLDDSQTEMFLRQRCFSKIAFAEIIIFLCVLDGGEAIFFFFFSI